MALSYDAYLKEVHHSITPVIRVYIAGEDVTSRLKLDPGIQTDWILDTPSLSVFLTSELVMFLDNGDNMFSHQNRNNFFVSQGYDANGYQVPAYVTAAFEGDNAPSDPVTLFAGEIESVVEVTPPVDHASADRGVRILLLDKSIRLRRAFTDDFGLQLKHTLGGPDYNKNYSAVRPVIDFPINSAPISRGSFSGRIGDNSLNVLPTIRRVGIHTPLELDVAVDLENGKLYFGTEPESEESVRVQGDYKAAYRYRTPEFLIYQLGLRHGIYKGMNTEELAFARSLLKSPTMEYERRTLSGHGRVGRGGFYPVIRHVYSDLSGFYFCGDRKFYRYQRRTTTGFDEYSDLGTCPDGKVLMKMVKHGDGDYYFLATSNWNGSYGAVLYYFNGTTWTEVSGAEPEVSFPYDYSANRDDTVSNRLTRCPDAASDNRKSFVIHRVNDVDYLYYVFGNSSNGLVRNGVRRVNLTNRTVENVYTTGIGSDYGIDFVISGSRLYVFVCQRVARGNDFFRIIEMDLDGNNPSEIHLETFSDRNTPGTASDIVVLNNTFYFVFTEHRSVSRAGRSSLCSLPIIGGTRRIYKYYDNSLFGARSLLVWNNEVFFLEGQWLSQFGVSDGYPTHAEAGHFGKINTSDVLIDLGPVWESYNDPAGTGLGMHTAFSSNLHYDSTTDALHFIAGYGIPANRADNTVVTADIVHGEIDNWMWVQYGKKLSTKIRVFPTNGRRAWDLMEELARVVDWELGFSPAEKELDDLYASNPTLDRFSINTYLFFRPRNPIVQRLVLDGATNVALQDELDSTLIFNQVHVAYGSSVWPEEDEDLILQEGARAFQIPVGLLSDQDGVWAELLARRLLARQKVPRLKLRLALKFAPHLQLGQRVRVTSVRNVLTEVAFKLTQIQHDTSQWQTFIEAREEIDPFLSWDDEIPDMVFLKDQSISPVTLPTAAGGESPLDYELAMLVSGLTFDRTTRQLSGTPSVADTRVMTYTVTDSAEPQQFLHQDFRITVVDTVVTLPEVGLVHVRKDCYQKIVLPSAVGGVIPYRYELGQMVPGLDFNEGKREITGVAEEPDTRRVTYEVFDFTGTAEQSFVMMTEDPGVWSGLYVLPADGENDVPAKVGVLDNEGNRLRGYNYSTKTRMINQVSLETTDDLALGMGDWIGCCATGSHRIFVDNEGNRGVFYSNGGATPVEVLLGDGDWRDVVVLPSGNVGFFDFDTATFRVYSTGGSRVSADDIELQYVVDIVSAVVHDGKIWTVVRGSDQLITWDINPIDDDQSEYDGQHALIPSDFQQMIEGVTDWEALAWTGTHFLLLRAEATRLFAVSAAGVRSVENDLSLWGEFE
ncbi:hypothetical protein F4X90_22515 [Candidatus Poribacteria bacterium]|nr:hypothetical protein [Candidatus Poribacteria bacterium]